MQKKLNLKIKYRESFRPFAPSVLEEYAGEYFQIYGASPYMCLVKQVTEAHKRPRPSDFLMKSWSDKLEKKLSDIPAVTHVDYSARIQTVNTETNPRFRQLIESFNALTGCPVLINTSFNVRGEPIVNTPDEAYKCFMNTEMDFLVINNFLFSKSDQPEWKHNFDIQTKND